jgi:triosephosphate isomerase (TIM)
VRTPIVAGNWKMYGSKKSVAKLLTKLQISIDAPDVEVIVFPPYVFLGQTERILAGSYVYWGAQNVSERPDGAFTGEISAAMLREFNCSYVIVGHSERRQLFAESSEQVAAKFIIAGKFGLKPVLCVGETMAEREAGKTNDVIAAQLMPILAREDGLTVLQRDAIIAYEPVWAIGTGLTASPEQAQETHVWIRQQVAEYDRTLAQRLSILYGGSVKRSNAEALFAMPDIDGGLIGGASLDAEEFLDIIKICKHCY